MHDCHSKYIISFWGAFLADPNICICMEFMDKGSLDGIYKKIGPIDIDIVSKVALAVLEGLTYLYDVHRIIHRGKSGLPFLNSKNTITWWRCMFLLVFRYQTFQYLIQFSRRNQDMWFWCFRRTHQFHRGHIRGHINVHECRSTSSMRDFSSWLSNSLTATISIPSFSYGLMEIPCCLQPERIQGAQYTVKSDVWSLGISLIELALGRFPFSESTSDDEDSDYEGTLSPARPGSLSLSGLPPARLKKGTQKKKANRKSKGVSLQGGGMTMSILELLQHIVNEPAPRLMPEGRYPKEAESFIDSCLLKDPDSRKTPKDLLVSRHTYFHSSTSYRYDSPVFRRKHG